MKKRKASTYFNGRYKLGTEFFSTNKFGQRNHYRIIGVNIMGLYQLEGLGQTRKQMIEALQQAKDRNPNDPDIQSIQEKDFCIYENIQPEWFRDRQIEIIR